VTRFDFHHVTPAAGGASVGFNKIVGSNAVWVWCAIHVDCCLLSSLHIEDVITALPQQLACRPLSLATLMGASPQFAPHSVLAPGIRQAGGTQHGRPKKQQCQKIIVGKHGGEAGGS
jgi:hypothetical protein